jgi:hypothetical protein
LGFLWEAVPPKRAFPSWDFSRGPWEARRNRVVLSNANPPFFFEELTVSRFEIDELTSDTNCHWSTATGQLPLVNCHWSTATGQPPKMLKAGGDNRSLPVQR